MEIRPMDEGQEECPETEEGAEQIESRPLPPLIVMQIRDQRIGRAIQGSAADPQEQYGGTQV
jgi:hypothetical protein